MYHGNILLMDNKHRKLFVIKQSKGCKFMSIYICTKIRLAAGLRPNPLEELMCSPGAPGRNGEDLLLREVEERAYL